jgi:hypothetical protein
MAFLDLLCGLVFLVTHPEVPGSISGATRFFLVVGLERGLFSLVRITEEVFE